MVVYQLSLIFNHSQKATLLIMTRKEFRGSFLGLPYLGNICALSKDSARQYLKDHAEYLQL